MSNEAPVVTVDGPGGSGKGTLSRLLGQRLGYHLLDSGALYRLTALAAERHGACLDDPEELARLAVGLDSRFETDAAGRQRVLLEEREVSAALRTEACGEAASRVAALPTVRAALLERQRAFRQPPGLVADGRDMGTVVFPRAELKIFLTADREERARRRYNQLKEQGIDATLNGLLGELAVRDGRDRDRSLAPLTPAQDAIVIDSTALSIDAMLERALALAETLHT